ncbi:hypothetical protein L486_01773 [Kwoniella mangroviensis CBS 10435]|uniref:Uncharacterized protein n=1 Tax=Kwoniella mangroviensis CBS 10435 TaxID=1331196 RepID=A0A1B9J2U1_9TREE|nr:hypothetical protein L486_01773 [Kwoniella mangroviensis CBS 10435]
MPQPSPIAIPSHSLNLSSDDFKGDSKTGDPPPPPLEQESVQTLTREDVAVKLMDELEKDKGGGSSKVWDDRENAVNEVNVDVDEEDHVDGSLSPTGEVSMIDKQDDERVDKSPVAFEGQNVSTPLFSDDKQDYISPAILLSTDRREANEDPAPTSEVIEDERTAPAGPARYPIANRRPKGWISSLNHPRAISNLTDQQIALTPPRSSSTSDLPKAENRARVSSVHIHQQQRAGTRRISGTMQYAFTQPQSQRASRERPLHNEEQSEDQDQAGNGDGDISIVDDDQEEGEDVVEQLSPEDEARIRYEVGLSQDQDEIWMEYVRNQLSSLFPDFFGADPGQLQAQMGEATYLGHGYQQEAESGVYQESQQEGAMEGDGEGGEQMTMEDGVERIGSPLFPPEDATSRINGRSEPVSSIDSLSSRRMSTSRNVHDVYSTPANDRSFISNGSSTDFSSLPTPPMRSNAEMLRGNVMIPNVRDEISGLREEIERLRSVVGGLAQELGGGSGGQNREQQNQEVVRENEIDGGIVNAESQVEGGLDKEQSHGPDAAIVQEAEGVESVRVKEEDDQTRKNDSQLEEENPETEKEEQVPEAFLKTANISSEIIHLLDSQIRKSAKRDAEVGDTRSDEEVFSIANLERVMRYVKGLGPS